MFERFVGGEGDGFDRCDKTVMVEATDLSVAWLWEDDTNVETRRNFSDLHLRSGSQSPAKRVYKLKIETVFFFFFSCSVPKISSAAHTPANTRPFFSFLFFLFFFFHELHIRCENRAASSERATEQLHRLDGSEHPRA